MTPKPLSPLLHLTLTHAVDAVLPHAVHPHQAAQGSGRENSVNLLDKAHTAPYGTQKPYVILPTVLTPRCTGVELKNKEIWGFFNATNVPPESSAGASQEERVPVAGPQARGVEQHPWQAGMGGFVNRPYTSRAAVGEGRWFFFSQ